MEQRRDTICNAAGKHYEVREGVLLSDIRKSFNRSKERLKKFICLGSKSPAVPKADSSLRAQGVDFGDLCLTPRT